MVISKKIVAILIISLLILPISISVLADTAANGGAIGSRSTTGASRQGENEIRVYFHRNNIMDTNPPTQSTPSQQISLTNGQEHDFALAPALLDNLEVFGQDTVGTVKGFKVDIETRTATVTGETSITIQVLDNSNVIAQGSKSFGTSSNEDSFNIPFLNTALQKYTFNKGHVIHVKINATITGAGAAPVILQIDTTTNNGYIVLACDQITSITVGAVDKDGIGGEFYPNWPDTEDRVIIFKGDVVDKLGAYDIQRVEVEVETIFTRTEVDEYIYDIGSDTGHYSYQWDYDKGIAPGKKTYYVYMTDNTGNEYTESGSFTMAFYGVYIECENNSKYGNPGNDVSYTIDVYNIGGNSDSISLNAASEPSGWTASLSKSVTKSLNGGDKDTITCTVTIPESAYENQECITTVTGTSNSDKEPPIGTDSVQLFTIARALFSFKLEVDKKSAQIDLGGYTYFTFTITNDGDGQDTYRVFLDDSQAPSGWEYTLSMTGTYTELVEDTEYEIVLDSGESAEAQLKVECSVNPSVDSVSVTLKVESENITDPGDKLKSESVTVTTETGPTDPVTLSALITEKTADPGSSIDSNAFMEVYFDLTVENTAVTTTYNITIDTVAPTPNGFQFEFSEDSFSLAGGASQTVQLTVSLPKTTMYTEEGFKFAVDADYDSQHTSSIEFTVKIEELIAVKLESTETEQTIDWKASADYEITITNLGNVKNVKLEIIYTGLPDDWDLILSSTSITLGDHNATKTVSITVTPSKEVKSNDKAIVDVSVETSDGNKKLGNSVTLTTTVEKDAMDELGNFFNEFWIIFIFVIVIIVVTAVVYRRMK